MSFPDNVKDENNGRNGKKGRGMYFKDYDINLEDNIYIGPSDGNNRKYRRPSAQYTDPIWQLGWTDGRLGQPIEPNEAVLRSQARLEWREEVRATEAQKAEAQATVESLRRRLEPLQEKLELAQFQFQELSRKHMERAHNASLLLASIYLFFAAVLFIADVPLSLNIVAKGFKIDIEKKIPGTNQWVSVGNILSSPWLVLENLWEPIFLALGIAFMGVIVKFFMDMVIFRDEGEEKLSTSAKIVLTLALISFVVTTVILGLFRAGIHHKVVGGTNAFEAATFITLTLMFPITGGICFSAGWRRLERAKQYYFAKAYLWRLQKRHDAVHLKYKHASEKLEALKLRLETEPERADSLADLRQNLYRHGYYRGQNVPDTIDAEEDLHTRCKKSVERILSRKLRKRFADFDRD